MMRRWPAKNGWSGANARVPRCRVDDGGRVRRSHVGVDRVRRGTAHQRALGTESHAAGAADFDFRGAALPLHFALDGAPNRAGSARKATGDRAAEDAVFQAARRAAAQLAESGGAFRQSFLLPEGDFRVARAWRAASATPSQTTRGASPQAPAQRSTSRRPAAFSHDVREVRRALDVTRRSQTDGRRVLRRRSEAEQMIEGRDPEHPAGRKAQLAGDFFQQRRRQIPIQLLRRVQNLDQRVTGIVVAHHHGFQQLFTFVFVMRGSFRSSVNTLSLCCLDGFRGRPLPVHPPG